MFFVHVFCRGVSRFDSGVWGSAGKDVAKCEDVGALRDGLNENSPRSFVIAILSNRGMKIFQKESVRERKIEMIFLFNRLQWSSSQSKRGLLPSGVFAIANTPTYKKKHL